jgi:glycosyltransferase involved in cell wall biosynthesis
MVERPLGNRDFPEIEVQMAVVRAAPFEIALGGPRVSIGMPVYNAEEFIEDALVSILDQTFGDFEVVISDNCSEDRTGAICEAFAAKDERIRYFRTGRNVGIVRNFNLTFQLSRGTYFKWAAHDDVLAPEYLETAVAVLDRDPSVVLAAPAVALIDSTGHPLPFDETEGVFVTSHGEKVSAMKRATGCGSSSAEIRFRSVVLDLRSSVLNSFVFGLARSEALAQTRLHDFYLGSEKVVLAQLSLIGRLEQIEEPLFFWRIHPGHSGKTRRSPRDRSHVADITRRMDPQWRGRFPLMGLKQLFGYARVIRHSSIAPFEKARCALVLAEKFLHALARKSRGYVTARPS